MRNFMNKPWTWGTYFKLCGVSLLFSVGYIILLLKWPFKK